MTGLRLPDRRRLQHLRRRNDDLAGFETSIGLDDYPVAVLDLKCPRVEEIGLP